MNTGEINIGNREIPSEDGTIRLHGNPFITKKREIPVSQRPKGYLKVRELLSSVKTDIANDIIANR